MPQNRVERHLVPLALTLLLTAGLLMPLLGALDMEVPAGSCALIAVLLAAGLEAASDSRKTAAIGGAALTAGFLLWLAAGGGAETLQNVLRAFALQVSGVPGALPLAAAETAVLLTATVTLLSFFSTRESAGSLGAALMTVAAALAIWLANRTDLVPRLLPAVAATLVILARDRHREIRPGRLFPWAALLVLLAWVLTPSTGAVYPPLKEKADELRQTVMDRMFFTEPRDVFSLASEGFYSQGTGQLGGPAHPSDHPVMQVSAPRQTYLRGVTMNSYDGRAWRNTLGGRRYLWDSPSMASRRSQLFDEKLPAEGLHSSATEPMEVSVRMLGDGTSTLFVPQRIRELRAGGDLVPYFSNASEVFITRNLQAGDTWTARAALFQAGDPGLGILVDAAGSTLDPQWEEVLETYPALPPHLEEPVWQMAADITAGIQSPYEKAFALQSYLSRNYQYTLEAEIQPASIDFVTHFLFNTRKGYCTYFASAMTVLCRMAGLPARYVEGYLAEPDDRGEALVTGLDAHAWTEVYFSGFGWLTFDATPRRSSRQDPGQNQREEQPTPSPEEEPEQTPTPEETPEPEEEPEEQEPPQTPEPSPGEDTPEDDSPEEKEADKAGFPWWVLIMLAAAALLTGRWIQTDPARREKRAENEEARFDLWAREAGSRLEAMGIRRNPGETPMSFTRRLDGTGKVPARLGTLGECISLLHYGRVHALETDTDLARQTARELKKHMKIRSRVRYAVNRMKPGKRPNPLMDGGAPEKKNSKGNGRGRKDGRQNAD